MKIFKSKWMMTFLAVLGMALCFSGGYATAKLTQAKPVMPKNVKKGTPPQGAPEGTPPSGGSSDSSQSDSDSDSNSSSNSNSNSSITNG